MTIHYAFLEGSKSFKYVHIILINNRRIIHEIGKQNAVGKQEHYIGFNVGILIKKAITKFRSFHSFLFCFVLFFVLLNNVSMLKSTWNMHQNEYKQAYVWSSGSCERVANVHDFTECNYFNKELK